MKRLLFLAWLVVSSGTLWSQDFTNKGKDFWLCFPAHVPNSNFLAKLSLFITSDQASSGTIQIGSTTINTFSIAANALQEIDIPYNQAYISNSESNTLVNKGIRVLVDPGKPPVVAYAHIYANRRSAASLILPVHVLGRKYYTMNCKQDYDGGAAAFSQFQVVAVEDNTIVRITPRVGGILQAPLPDITMLTKGQVFQYQSSSDLTGSIIESIASPTPGSGCKPVAVFSGSSALTIETSSGCNSNSQNSFDPLYQQMYPVTSWGKKFAFVPFAEYTNGNPYRVLASENGTQVFQGGNLVATLNAGEYYQSTNNAGLANALNSALFITANKPIAVAQYAQAARCRSSTTGGSVGDPDMLMLNPIEQTVNNITVFSSKKENIVNRYIQVVIKDVAKGSFKINNGTFNVPNTWQSLSPAAEGYVYLQIPIPLIDVNNSYTLTADSNFNAIAYGFGVTESYAYSAGANVKDLFQFFEVTNDSATVNFPAGCTQTPMRFSMTSRNKVTSITWNFNGLFKFNNGTSNDTTIYRTPAAADWDSSWLQDGKTLYQYSLDRFFSVNTAQEQTIKVIANIVNDEGCNGTQEIEYKLKIYDRPKAGFASPAEVCQDAPALFTDTSKGLQRSITQYYWEIDGVSGTGTSFSGNYSTSGTRTARHWVINDLGCLSDTVTQSIVVHPLPVANFRLLGRACGNRITAFQDISLPNAGGISTRVWTFPDGSSLTGGNVNYAFPGPGDYPVKLAVQNTNLCSKDTLIQVHAYDIPRPDFLTPKICRTDPLAQFTNLSVPGDTSSLTYLWDFGDPASPNNSSTAQDPTHNYVNSGTYTVKLKLTASNTCDSALSKVFTVNGVNPRASFTIDPTANWCANHPVTIREASNVLDGGNIIRVEVLWDEVNDPANDTIDDKPQTGAVYSVQYPEFSNPLSKTYQIRYRAFSGNTCVNDTTAILTLNASPSVSFNLLNPVCEEVAPFTLTEASETSGMPGNGVYSGPGVNAFGVFSPKLAGPGDHLIRYTYTSVDNGCADADSQTLKVYPQPTAYAGPDTTMLEGSYTILQGGGSGNNLSFLWLPADSIDGSNLVQKPRVSPSEDYIFTLVVTSSQGCHDTDFVKVTVLKNLLVPNAFSPNGDGINDTWRIEHVNTYPDAVLQVFNRYGQLVFQSKGYHAPWNGTMNGNPLPVGTYYWILNPGSGRKQMNGAVTILR